jgi:membrane protein DedA with SNARE-associated domain
MDLRQFIIYTSVGSSIWTAALAILGFLIGENQDLIEKHLHEIIIACIILCAATAVIYMLRKPARK